MPRNPLRLLAAVAATAAIAAVLAACGAAGDESPITADALKGTWTGELNGYGMAKADNNVIKEFTISDVVGSAFTGQVRHRPADGAGQDAGSVLGRQQEAADAGQHPLLAGVAEGGLGDGRGGGEGRGVRHRAGAGQPDQGGDQLRPHELGIGQRVFKVAFSTP